MAPAPRPGRGRGSLEPDGLEEDPTNADNSSLLIRPASALLEAAASCSGVLSLALLATDRVQASGGGALRGPALGGPGRADVGPLDVRVEVLVYLAGLGRPAPPGGTRTWSAVHVRSPLARASARRRRPAARRRDAGRARRRS